MKTRAVVLQGGLAVLALAAAYLTWQRRPELQADEAFILDITKSELHKVVFEDDFNKNTVELEPAKDDNGSSVTVLLVHKPDDPGSPTQRHLLRGNEAATTQFARFAPLRAVRALGTLPEAKLKDLHLDTPKIHLTVTTRTGARVFDLATPPKAGNDVYVRDRSDGRVFIIIRPILVDFTNAANSLIERRLHTFRPEEADRLTVSAGTARKDLRMVRAGDGKGIELADPSTPDKPDVLARTWHDRVIGLTVTEVLGKDEKVKEGEPVVRLRLEYASRGRKLGWLELAEIPNAAEGLASNTAKPALYARSELTLGWNKLGGNIEHLIAEGLKLAGAKP